MLQRGLDEIGDVPIREAVDEVVAVAFAIDESFVAQDFEALRDGGELVVHGGDDVGDASLAVAQKVEDAKPGAVAQSAKEPRRPIERRRRTGRGDVRMVPRPATGFRRFRRRATTFSECDGPPRFLPSVFHGIVK